MIMMLQCRFIDCNICTTLVGDVDTEKTTSGGGGAGDSQGPSVLSGQFCCEPNTALKNKVSF